MATVIGNETDIRLEFTSYEVDLMREIAFNTGRSLDQIAAERLAHGIVCEQPGEDADYQLTYTPKRVDGDAEDKPLEVKLEPVGNTSDYLTSCEYVLRTELNTILTELYNIAWSDGLFSYSADPEYDQDNSLDKNTRTVRVVQAIDRIMNEVYDYEP